MKRSKCLLSTIHSVKILKHITGSTTRNVKNFETHCGLYNPQFKIISKMNCRLYNPQCVSKNFTLRAVELAIRFLKFLHCRLYNLQYILKKICIFTLRVVQPAIHLKKNCNPQCIYKLFCFASCTTSNMLWCSGYHLSLTQ